MDELARYIFNYYSHLLTPDELSAHRTLLVEAKIAHTDSYEMKQWLREDLVYIDPKVLALLEAGPPSFFERVRDRVMREHKEKVFLNLCPICNALAKTPTAKQCPKCFFSWHDDV